VKDTPAGVIEELQIQAIESAAEIGCPMQDTLEWEVAELLAEWLALLELVRDGAAGPAEVAEALRPPFTE